jgi:hypothetical protein
LTWRRKGDADSFSVLASAPQDEDEPRPKRRRNEEDDEEQPSRKKKSRPAKKQLPLGLLIGQEKLSASPFLSPKTTLGVRRAP